jgi:uncharacterized protein (TIGR03435 family)
MYTQSLNIYHSISIIGWFFAVGTSCNPISWGCGARKVVCQVGRIAALWTLFWAPILMEAQVAVSSTVNNSNTERRIARGRGIALPVSSERESRVTYVSPMAGGGAFQVVSIAQSGAGGKGTEGQQTSSTAVYPGVANLAIGGTFKATNTSLLTYISFAYNLAPHDVQWLSRQLPEWAKSQRYDIWGTALGNPGRNEIRLMMRSILAEHFHLIMHRESRELPVYALVLANEQSLKSQLRRHPSGTPCSDDVPPESKCSVCALVSSQWSPENFPASCGQLAVLPSNARDSIDLGASAVSIQFIAYALAGAGNLDRPVVDETGLQGTFDFVFHLKESSSSSDNGAIAIQSQQMQIFMNAITEQLGLAIRPHTGRLQMITLDSIEPLGSQ